MAEPLLRVDSVSVVFGALRAVNGVSLSIGAGERRAVIGPNGAGKTTLFNAIAGATLPTSGSILLDGRDVTRLTVSSRARLGVRRTFQITNLFGDLTVEDNVRLAVLGLSGRKFSLLGSSRLNGEMQNAVERALTNHRLLEKRHVPTQHLSYGEQRQLELALALARQPKLLLLDEPAAGLSPAERGDIAALIEALPRDLTLILIEHDMNLALGLVDTVTCMHYGEVLHEGTPDETRHNPRVQEVYLGKSRRA